MMAALQHSPDLTVAQTLQESPADVRPLFVARRTACVGCYLAGFCTLADVARTYQFPLEEFIGELDRAAGTNNPEPLGAQHG
jgi:hypothetical protein